MNLKLEMTSREIEVLTGKDHKNVIRDVERMFAQLKIEPGDFLDSYLDANNQSRKMYRLDKDLTMTLVTKYDTARRYAVVRRWRELEEQSQGRELSVEEVPSLILIPQNCVIFKINKLQKHFAKRRNESARSSFLKT